MAQAFLVQKSGGGGVNQTLPSQITAFEAIFDTTPSITLSWINPVEYWAGTLIVKKAGSIPEKISDGEKVYNGTGTTFVDTDVLFDTTYYYRAFPYNAKKQYQTTLMVASAKPKEELLLSELTVGSVIRVPVATEYQSFMGENVAWKIADKNHEGYPENSVTLITDKIIAIPCFDAKEAKNSNADRRRGGNNRYSVSNILQWLNSSASAGNWYTAQHSADVAPTAGTGSSAVTLYGSGYSHWAGFLAVFNSDFIAKLLDTTQVVALNTVTDGGGYENVVSKIFLPSRTEVGFDVTEIEGNKLALFDSTNDSRLAYPTQESIDSCGSTNPNLNVSSPWHWHTRSADVSTAQKLWEITNLGGYQSNAAYVDMTYGARPLCNISADTHLNPVPNADGSYSFIEGA